MSCQNGRGLSRSGDTARRMVSNQKTHECSKGSTTSWTSSAGTTASTRTLKHGRDMVLPEPFQTKKVVGGEDGRQFTPLKTRGHVPNAPRWGPVERRNRLTPGVSSRSDTNVLASGVSGEAMGIHSSTDLVSEDCDQTQAERVCCVCVGSGKEKTWRGKRGRNQNKRNDKREKRKLQYRKQKEHQKDQHNRKDVTMKRYIYRIGHGANIV